MRDYRTFNHGNLFHFFLAIIVIGGAATLFAKAATPQANYPNCRGWIIFSCCCTTGACREVEKGELERISDGQWRVVETGEIIQRTGWSRDNTFIRCAATYSAAQSQWLIGPQYRTTCLYEPVPGS